MNPKPRQRQRKPLPEGITDLASSQDKLKCNICTSIHTLPETFKRNGVQKHISSARHKSAVAALDKKRDDDAEAPERLAQIYQARIPDDEPEADMAGTNFEDVGPSAIPSMFSASTLPHTEASSQSAPFFMTSRVHEEDVARERERLKRQAELISLQAEHANEFGDDEDDPDLLSNVAHLFDDLDGDNDTNEEMDKYYSAASADKLYFPYPNRTAMLLDILLNLPRLRLSSAHTKMIIWLLRQCGVANVPGYNTLLSIQKKIRAECASPPVHHVSASGNVFYTNDVRESIAKDFANPQTAAHMHLYPEKTDGPISEVWQAERWQEYKPEEIAPMYSNGIRRFYVNELAELENGDLVIPQNWYNQGGRLYADCIKVVGTESGMHITADTEQVFSGLFKWTYLDICARQENEVVRWSNECAKLPPIMPNPLRELAEGEDLYTVMIPLWCDDVSGNKSKQYNKHMNIYMANSSLPGRLLQQEYFVRFVSSSPTASSAEQFSALREQIADTQKNPIRCYNAHTNRPCRVILRVPGLPADNPQQSEEASHIGGNGNRICRKCDAGGPYQVKESDDGYDALYKAGKPRTAAETRQSLEKQLEWAIKGEKDAIAEEQKDKGIKDKTAQYWIDILLTKSWDMSEAELRQWFEAQPGDKINPLLDFEGLDPNKDTPIEILHTILLGIVKYVWHMLHTSLSEQDQKTFATRLQSSDLSGLNVPPLRASYMMQYRNNLIGKHFKTLMQIMIFHLHDLVTPQQFVLARAVGDLGSLLWVPEIDNMDQYLADLEIVIGNVLDAFGDAEPSKITKKMKLHLLVHLPEDIRRFGPAIRSSTEIFECYNAIFRFCSVLSNHQAPSRDIARQFSSMDSVKHILSGGYWKDCEGNWVQAGGEVQNILRSQTFIQSHLGWVPPANNPAGFVRFQQSRRAKYIPWMETLTARVVQEYHLEENQMFDSLRPAKHRIGIAIKAQSGDMCSAGAWVFARTDRDEVSRCRILEILVPESGELVGKTCVLAERFLLGRDRHPDFLMPVLKRPDRVEDRLLVLNGMSIIFQFSAQHDCRTARCEATGERTERQERENTTRTMKILAHKDDAHFVINMHGLHNSHRLRKALPRELVEPEPLYTNRKQHHQQIAKGLRTTQAEKRKVTQQKRKATADANKAKRVAKAAAIEEDRLRREKETQEAAEESGEETDSGEEQGRQDDDDQDSEAEEVLEQEERPSKRRRTVTY